MGKLNISHHKSWHVYNQKNKDIVKKDELEAEKLTLEKEARIQKAEQEARLDKLRCQASNSSNTSIQQKEQIGHINLFPLADQVEQNPEYLEEEMKKKKKAEAPFTMYLSQSTKDPAPWYSKTSNIESKSNEYKDALRKEALDPIKDIKKNDSSLNKESIKVKSKSQGSSSSSSSIEKLRQQRLEREAKERARQDHLLNPSKSQSLLKERHSYHSQFNPDAVSRSKSSSDRYNPYKYL